MQCAGRMWCCHFVRIISIECNVGSRTTCISANTACMPQCLFRPYHLSLFSRAKGTHSNPPFALLRLLPPPLPSHSIPQVMSVSRTRVSTVPISSHGGLRTSPPVTAPYPSPSSVQSRPWRAPGCASGAVTWGAVSRTLLPHSREASQLLQHQLQWMRPFVDVSASNLSRQLSGVRSGVVPSAKPAWSQGCQSVAERRLLSLHR